MKRIIILAFAALQFAAAEAQKAPIAPQASPKTTQNGQGRHHGQKNGQHQNPEIRAARQAFFTEKALPVMQAQHKIMMGKLSAQDIKFIESKRQEQAQLKQKMRLLRREMHKAHKGGASPEAVQAQFGEQLKAMRAEKEAFYKTMESFVSRNSNTLDPIRAELKKVHEEWRSERKELRQKLELNKPQNKEKGENKGQNNPQRHANKTARHEHRFIDFILWDGKSNPMPQRNSPEQRRAAKEITNPLHISSFPNPAQGQTTIRLQLPQAAKDVSLRIIDTQGKTVFTQNLKSLPAGQQQIPVDISQLAAGTYFYTIIADGQTAAATMVVK
jgi:hypothetical protein